jgi:hypothetical protein
LVRVLAGCSWGRLQNWPSDRSKAGRRADFEAFLTGIKTWPQSVSLAKTCYPGAPVTITDSNGSGYRLTDRQSRPSGLFRLGPVLPRALPQVAGALGAMSVQYLGLRYLGWPWWGTLQVANRCIVAVMSRIGADYF